MSGKDRENEYALDLGAGAGFRVLGQSTKRVTIGRDSSNDVVVPNDTTVSRRHAILERRDGVWRLIDLKSRNGTFVSGIRVNQSANIDPGDSIAVGETTFRLLRLADVPSNFVRTELPNQISEKYQLSPREREVLRLLAEGLSDSEIAEELILSVKTVQSHLDRIRDKTQQRKRAELTLIAIQLGLVQP